MGSFQKLFKDYYFNDGHTFLWSLRCGIFWWRWGRLATIIVISVSILSCLFHTYTRTYTKLEDIAPIFMINIHYYSRTFRHSTSFFRLYPSWSGEGSAAILAWTCSAITISFQRAKFQMNCFRNKLFSCQCRCLHFYI